ncbi:hypothetical protein DSUL_60300 [Desulfovibrionales bacterium]
MAYIALYLEPKIESSLNYPGQIPKLSSQNLIAETMHHCLTERDATKKRNRSLPRYILRLSLHYISCPIHMGTFCATPSKTAN